VVKVVVLMVEVAAMIELAVVEMAFARSKVALSGTTPATNMAAHMATTPTATHMTASSSATACRRKSTSAASMTATTTATASAPTTAAPTASD
jgi:hypothetical protein